MYDPEAVKNVGIQQWIIVGWSKSEKVSGNSAIISAYINLLVLINDLQVTWLMWSYRPKDKTSKKGK